MSVFSSLIKECRLNQKLSIRSAATLIGISYTYLNNLEKGLDKSTGTVNKPTPETLKLISSAYHLEYSYLLELWGYLAKSDLEVSPKVQELLSTCKGFTDKDIDLVIEFAKYILWKNTKRS